MNDPVAESRSDSTSALALGGVADAEVLWSSGSVSNREIF